MTTLSSWSDSVKACVSNVKKLILPLPESKQIPIQPERIHFIERLSTPLKAAIQKFVLLLSDIESEDQLYINSNMPEYSRDQLIFQILKLVLSLGISYFVGMKIIEMMDPTKKEKKAAKLRAQEVMQRIGVSGIKLTEHELCFAADLVDPESIAISWHDIGGLDQTIRTIREKVIFPFKRRDLLAGSALIRPPKGVLLYGPPGCGKTTIAKAMAKDAGARFINFQMSSLLDKWHGESEKRADALFSLARKIQPAIIFIDEIDSFLRVRNLSDHANMATLKGQFMSLWDGLITDATCQIMVVGATNRPQDVDAAILRRMSSKFSIGKPAQVERKNILGIILRTEELDETVDLDQLAGETEEFSGSELLEACRLGATHRIHEIMRKANKSHLDDIYNVQIDRLRKMSMEDLMLGVNEVRQAKYGISGQEFSTLVLD